MKLYICSSQRHIIKKCPDFRLIPHTKVNLNPNPLGRLSLQFLQSSLFRTDISPKYRIWFQAMCFQTWYLPPLREILPSSDPLHCPQLALSLLTAQALMMVPSSAMASPRKRDVAVIALCSVAILVMSASITPPIRIKCRQISCAWQAMATPHGHAMADETSTARNHVVVGHREF